MLVRYRYRAYPTPGQVALLARTFGCARVVFNDALRARQDAHAAGEKISDSEVQRRVVTLAKTTSERQSLVRSRRLLWCRHVRTRGVRTGTGSTPCPVRVRAARLGTHGSGLVRTADSRSD